MEMKLSIKSIILSTFTCLNCCMTMIYFGVCNCCENIYPMALGWLTYKRHIYGNESDIFESQLFSLKLNNSLDWINWMRPFNLLVLPPLLLSLHPSCHYFTNILFAVMCVVYSPIAQSASKFFCVFVGESWGSCFSMVTIDVALHWNEYHLHFQQTRDHLALPNDI